jgi:hypothetical protein
MAKVPDAKAQPKAENAHFLTHVAFIPNLLPKMENQSFETLATIRTTLFVRAFPYHDISYAAYYSVRMRKPPGTVYSTVLVPDKITSFSVNYQCPKKWCDAIPQKSYREAVVGTPTRWFRPKLLGLWTPVAPCKPSKQLTGSPRGFLLTFKQNQRQRFMICYQQLALVKRCKVQNIA